MAAVVGMTNVNECPPKGWLRIQMEPIDVPIETDESILFSIIQSSIPGAHSLYYKENGVQKALKYDSTNGRIFKPSQGWDSSPIFVNIAHGCRPYGKKMDAYTVATERFEKSVELVQKMLGVSAGAYLKKGKGLDSIPVGAILREKGLLKKSLPKEEIIDKDILLKEENAKKETKIKVDDGQMKKLENEINELKKNNTTLEKELKECKEWMIDAKKMFNELRMNTPVSEKERISEASYESQTNTLENMDSSKILSESQETKALQFENDTLKQELTMAEQKITELQEELTKKDFVMNNNRYNSSQIHPTNLYTNQHQNHQQQPPQLNHQGSHHFYPPPLNYRGIGSQCCGSYGGYPSYLDNPLYKAPYEEELDLKRKQLELADNKIRTLEAEIEFEKKRIEKNEGNLSHGFLIKKQPCGLRNKNDILTTDFLTKNGYEMKRTWFEIELPWKATDVFIVGSFTNWECALKCNPLRNSNNKYGIWCDVPKGTHEFKFIADGAWVHSSFYQACSNDFKTLNNFISVN